MQDPNWKFKFYLELLNIRKGIDDEELEDTNRLGYFLFKKLLEYTEDFFGHSIDYDDLWYLEKYMRNLYPHAYFYFYINKKENRDYKYDIAYYVLG